MKKPVETGEIQIVEIQQETIHVYLLGRSPLIFNRMSEKAKRELLMPKGRKTAFDKASSFKHLPIEEYRASVYRNSDGCPTRLKFPAPAFKGAMSQAALDLPGAKKSEIGRLCWAEGTHVDIYGVPQLLMSVVRSADINKTPDIRTRAIVPNWCAKISISFVKPKMTAAGVVNLLAAAGVVCGIGDFRQEKGKGSFGQFSLVAADDAEWLNLERNAGIKTQDKALQEPDYYDDETEELFEWFNREFSLRNGTKVVA